MRQQRCRNQRSANELLMVVQRWIAGVRRQMGRLLVLRMMVAAVLLVVVVTELHELALVGRRRRRNGRGGEQVRMMRMVEQLLLGRRIGRVTVNGRG